MSYELICTTAFDGRKRGDRITDPATIAAILADSREAYVVRVAPASSVPVSHS